MNDFSSIPSESEIRELAPVGWGEIAPGGSGFEREPEVAPKFTPLPFYGAGPDGEGLLPRLGY
jgi:hypothetical protein